MRASEALLDFGRPVSFYPGLVKRLGGVTATLFFCQIFYWTGKNSDPLGIFKTAEEISRETGLTYEEQVTARKKLKSRGVLIETEKRLDHRMYYRLDLDAFDDLQIPETGNAQSGDSGMPNPGARQSLVRNKEAETTAEITADIETPEAGLFVLDSPEKEKPQTDPGPTRADIDGYCDDIYGLYPKKIAPRAAKSAIEKAMRRLTNGENPGGLKDLDDAYEWLFRRTEAYAKERHGQDEQFTPHPATWFNQGRYLDKQVKRA
jgi:hypothetical protein